MMGFEVQDENVQRIAAGLRMLRDRRAVVIGLVAVAHDDTAGKSYFVALRDGIPHADLAFVLRELAEKMLRAEGDSKTESVADGREAVSPTEDQGSNHDEGGARTAESGSAAQQPHTGRSRKGRKTK